MLDGERGEVWGQLSRIACVSLCVCVSVCVSSDHITQEQLQDKLKIFTGDIMQVPPL